MITKTHTENGERRTAIYSDCLRYRYLLEIEWDSQLPALQVIGLNPSTATELADDPTVTRCKFRAMAWGAGSLLMTNLFAYRATDPRVMKAFSEPVGSWNDHALSDAYSNAALSLAAWGTHGTHMGRCVKVRRQLPNLMCLAKTADGQPRHPLYLPYHLIPIDL